MNAKPWRISVRAIPQTTMKNCGPASAQMVLYTIGGKPPSQGKLLTEIQNVHTKDKRRKTPWVSSPDGLTKIVNSYRPRGFSGRYYLFASKSKIKFLKEMIWTLYRYGVPSIVLINSEAHWIVFYGCKNKGINPKRITDVRLVNFVGLYFRDPMQKVSSEGYQPLSVWAANSLESVYSGLWNNDYLLICDPDPKKKFVRNKLRQTLKTVIQKPYQKIADFQKLPFVPKKQDPQKSPIMQEVPVSPKVPVSPTKTDPKIVPYKGGKPMIKKMPKKSKKTSPKKTHVIPKIMTAIPKMPVIQLMKFGFGKQVMTYKSAKEVALWRLTYGGFYNPESVHLIMKRPTAGLPQLVKNLKNNNYYYCVPLKESRQIYANMILYATNGKLWECLFAIKRNLPLEFAPLPKKRIIGMIKKYDASIKVKPQMIQPVMVWKYCNESTTMFLPFYQVNTGKTSVYVRMDGEVFGNLTDF
jgi:hypothetical protein